MKKLKIIGVLTGVVMLAGVLALAGCDDVINTITVAGADIEPWALEVEGVTAGGFTITTPAVVAGANPGEQVPEYAVSTTTTAPTSGYQTSLTFTGRAADTPYYVFARSAAKDVGTTHYTSGTAVRAGGDPGTVTTLPAADDVSVVDTWTPILNSATADTVYFEDPTGAITFQVRTANAKQPNPGNQQVEYALGNSGTVEPTSGWQTSRSFQVSEIGSTQLYVWARTRQTGTYPAGKGLGKALNLPGPEIEFSENFGAQESNVTSNSGTVVITGSVTKTPNIPSLIIEYGLSTSSDTAPTGASEWQDSATSITFSGRSPNTEYYLWARTKFAANFRDGTAINYTAPNQEYIFKTAGNAESADALAAALRNRGATIELVSATNVVRMTDGTINLIDTLIIPNSVTLIIDGGEIDAQTKPITGGGMIIVSGTGKLIVYKGDVSVGSIIVSATGSPASGGKYYVAMSGSGAGGGNTDLLIGPASTPSSSIIGLTNSSITIKMDSNGRSSYTLETSVNAASNGKASIDKAFSLATGESFTVKSGVGLEVGTGGSVAGGGTMEIQSGGSLKATIANFNGFLTGGSLKINYGAVADFTGGVKIGYTTTTDISKTGDIDILNNPAGGNITLTRQYTGQTGETHLALTGYADIVTGSAVSITGYTLDIGAGARLTIPAGKEVKVSSSGTLNVSGTLELPESTATGGKLTLDGGNLIVGSTVNVRKGTSFTVSTANSKVTVGANGHLHIYTNYSNTTSSDVLATITNGEVSLNSGTITVHEGAVLNISTNDAKIKGTSNGKITVDRGGILSTDFSQFLGTTLFGANTTPDFLGSVVINGELWHGGSSNTTPYIGYTATTGTPAGATNPTKGFRLTNTSSNITLSAVMFNGAAIPVYTLNGNADVQGTIATGSATVVTADARFVVGTGTLTINDEKHLTVESGAELHLKSTLAGASTSGHWGILEIKAIGGLTRSSSGGTTSASISLRYPGQPTGVPLSSVWTTQTVIPVVTR